MEKIITCSECSSRIIVLEGKEKSCDHIDGLRAWRAELLRRIETLPDERERYTRMLEELESTLTWREHQAKEAEAAAQLAEDLADVQTERIKGLW